MAKKNILIELRKKIAKTLFNFSETVSVDGTIIVHEGDQLVEGIEVKTYDADGATITLPNGSYQIDEETSIMVEDGIVVKVDKPVEEAPVEEEVVAEETPIVEPIVEEPAEEEARDIAEDIVESVAPEVVETPNYEAIIEDLVAVIKGLQKDVASLQLEIIEQKTNLEKFSKQPLANPATIEVEDKEDKKFNKFNKAAQKISALNK